MTVVLMGATGAGKTTIGRQLAAELGWPFLDADSLHTADAVDRMRAGHALTDRDRDPWLQRVRDVIRDRHRHGPDLVVACSALKQRYRDVLTGGVADIRWVYLDASESLLRSRVQSRTGHFAGVGILPGQLADLEPPTDALIVPASLPVGEAVALIRKAIGS